MSAEMKCNKCGRIFGPYGCCPSCYSKDDVEIIQTKSDITTNLGIASKFLQKN